LILIYFHTSVPEDTRWFVPFPENTAVLHFMGSFERIPPKPPLSLDIIQKHPVTSRRIHRGKAKNRTPVKNFRFHYQPQRRVR